MWRVMEYVNVSINVKLDECCLQRTEREREKEGWRWREREREREGGGSLPSSVLKIRSFAKKKNPYERHPGHSFIVYVNGEETCTVFTDAAVIGFADFNIKEVLVYIFFLDPRGGVLQRHQRHPTTQQS